MGVLTALASWSPIPQRISGRLLRVVIDVTTVEDARAFGGTDDVVVGTESRRGGVLGSATAGADWMIAVSAVAAVGVAGPCGSDAESRRARSTETAMGARLRKMGSRGRSGELGHRRARSAPHRDEKHLA
jgi:hypothetical protein